MKPDVLVDSNIWIAKGDAPHWKEEHQAILAKYSSFGYCEIIKSELINHRYKMPDCNFSEAEEWAERVLSVGAVLQPQEDWENLSERLMNRLATDRELWDSAIKGSAADIRIASKAISMGLPIASNDTHFQIFEFFAPRDIVLETNLPPIEPAVVAGTTQYTGKKDTWQKSLARYNIDRKSKLIEDTNMKPLNDYKRAYGLD